MYWLTLISGYSMIIACIIGLVRFRAVPVAYQPFVYFTWLAFANDVLSSILVPIIHSNAVNSNVYVLVESLVLLWLFYNWGALRGKNWYLPVLVTTLLIVWVSDNLILNDIAKINSLFRIYYSFVLVFLGINQLNSMIVGERGNMLRNARFLICSGICIFYSYKAFLETFYLFRTKATIPLLNNVFLILVFVNIFVTLIYALAALWIPTRQKFTLPS